MKTKNLTKQTTLFFFIYLISGFLNLTIAQEHGDDTKLWYIETKKGKGYLGAITVQDSVLIIKRKEKSTITIKRDKVKSIEEAKIGRIRYRSYKYWPAQPASDLVIGVPNGFGLKSGEVHIQTALGVMYQVSTGITDHFSISAGSSFAFGGNVPFWIVPKVALPSIKDRIHFSVGAVLITQYDEDPVILGHPFATVTLGRPDLHLSVGFGLPFYDGKLENYSLRFLSASARISNRTHIRTENYIFIEEYSDYSFTFIGAKTCWTKFAFDYGFLMEVNPDRGIYVIPFPYLGASYTF